MKRQALTYLYIKLKYLYRFTTATTTNTTNNQNLPQFFAYSQSPIRFVLNE